jgi:thiamine-phosphate pyrophosphorylase
MSLSAASLRLIVVAGLEPDGSPPLERVAAAIRGGAGLIQLRGKSVPDRVLVDAARRLLPLCREAGVPMFVNDRPDIALAVRADGAHVGPDDLPPLEARRVLEILGLGVSARTADRLRRAEEAGATYVGAGALRASATKPSAPVLGLAGIADLAAATSLPVVAVGGVRPEDVADLKAAGVAGAAAAAAVLGDPDPEAAARRFIAAWEAS